MFSNVFSSMNFGKFTNQNTVDAPELAKDNPSSEAKFSLLNTVDVSVLAKDNPASEYS
ncbi:MAG: hypothetical protein H0W50_05805 [Parachlamydiaceae bacterium]|nr:hypothetical protein [Parachlamydiaceae bacterium]